jgi:hypothetical protein
MIIHGQSATTDANVAVPMSDIPVLVEWIWLQPKSDPTGMPTNVSTVWIGGEGISNTSGGYPLTEINQLVLWPGAYDDFYDLRRIFIVSAKAGDCAQWIAATAQQPEPLAVGGCASGAV